MKKNVVWIVLAVVLVIGAGVGGYFLGVDQGKSQTASAREQFMADRFGDTQPGDTGGFVPGQGLGGRQGAGLAGQGTVGTIKEIQGNTLIVSTAKLELKVEVGNDTRITLFAEGSASDLRAGDRISIGGQIDGDSMTATQIQVISEIP